MMIARSNLLLSPPFPSALNSSPLNNNNNNRTVPSIPSHHITSHHIAPRAPSRAALEAALGHLERHLAGRDLGAAQEREQRLVQRLGVVLLRHVAELRRAFGLVMFVVFMLFVVVVVVFWGGVLV